MRYLRIAIALLRPHASRIPNLRLRCAEIAELRRFFCCVLRSSVFVRFFALLLWLNRVSLVPFFVCKRCPRHFVVVAGVFVVCTCFGHLDKRGNPGGEILQRRDGFNSAFRCIFLFVDRSVHTIIKSCNFILNI